MQSDDEYLKRFMDELRPILLDSQSVPSTAVYDDAIWLTIAINEFGEVMPCDR